MNKPFAADPVPFGMTETLRDNIRRLEARRREETATAPFSDRIADAITGFTGSMRFVVLHVLIFGGWITANLGWLPGVTPFDPTFVALAMIASVEAIFLSTFVLISQNRMMTAANRGADLDLHISLLSEYELTKMAALLDRIASHLGVTVGDAGYEEIKQEVEPTSVMDALENERKATEAGASVKPQG